MHDFSISTKSAFSNIGVIKLTELDSTRLSKNKKICCLFVEIEIVSHIDTNAWSAKIKFNPEVGSS